MRRNGKGGRAQPDYLPIGPSEEELLDSTTSALVKKGGSSVASNVFGVIQSLIVISLVAVAIVGGVYTSIAFNTLNDHERRILFFEGDPRFTQILNTINSIRVNVSNLQADVNLLSNSTSITQTLISLDQKASGVMMNLTQLEINFWQEVLWRISNDTQIINNVTNLQNEVNILMNLIQSSNLTIFETQFLQETLWRIGNDTLIQNDLAAEVAARMAGDAQLFSDLANETALRIAADAEEAAARISNDTATMAMFQLTVKFVNNLPPNANNIDIVPGNSGINITNSGSTVSISNVGVVNLNAQAPDSMGTFLLNGESGIGVNPGMLSNQITVDGSIIQTAVNNLDITVSNHAAQLLNQIAVNADLYDLISNLALSGDTIINLLNGTQISFNETFVNLVNRVEALELQTALLAAQLANITSANEAIGVIKAWSGVSTSIPAGYLLCDGSLLSTASYPVLYSILLDVYCVSPPPMGQFCLPDLRGRVPVGFRSGDPNFATRGQYQGASTHTLLSTEMPSHTHSASDTGHTHDTIVRVPLSLYLKNSPAGIFTTIPGDASSCPIRAYEDFRYPWFADSINAWPSASDDVSGSNCFNGASNTLFRRSYSSNLGFSSINVGSAGSGAAHNNVQPSLTVGGYIIRVDP